MSEGDEEPELAASATLAAKRHRLLSGFTSLEKSDIAFLIAADFARAQADERWVDQEGEPAIRTLINAVEASSFLASPLCFQEFSRRYSAVQHATGSSRQP
jgi:hypothetical protein